MPKSTHYSPDFNLAHITTYQAGVVQAQFHRKLKQHVNAYLRPYGITMMEWFAVGLIRDAHDGMRLTDLAKALQTTLPYTTNLINHLENKQWVARDDHDNDSRAKLVRLTPHAQETCSEIELFLREKLRKLIYDRISPGEFQDYVKVIYTLSQ